MFMIMFVLDNYDYLEAVLKAWYELGVGGATIAETSGLHRFRKKRIPMRFTYSNLYNTEEVGNISVFAIVRNKQMVEECLKAVESVVGDLNEPNTGVFSAWPLAMTKGIKTKEQDKE